ncbi:MAG: type II toxin-antitoxin system HicB family antitoxin [Treponema sp.]
MKYVYPAVFHKDDKAFWVDFPDLKGCFSDGESDADALLNASEALERYLATLIEEKKILTKPSDIKNVKTDESSFCSLVAANVPENSKKDAYNSRFS